MFNLQEAAEQLGITPKAVWKLLSERKIQASGAPRPYTAKSVRFTQEDIDQRKAGKLEARQISMAYNKQLPRPTPRLYYP